MAYYIGYKMFTMKNYQAKTIQQILGMPKHRYDYMLMKIGIEPDLDKASGRGKTNLFSFSKLLEFAIANTAMNIGMLPEMIRMSLARIRRIDREESLQFFDPEVQIISLSYHTAWHLGAAFFFFTGNIRKERQRPRILVFADESENEDEVRGGDYDKLLSDMSTDVMSDIMGYSTLNLARIKKFVITKM